MSASNPNPFIQTYSTVLIVVCVSLYVAIRRDSAQSGPDQPSQVPHVAAVLLAGLPARLPSAVRRPGPSGRLCVSPPAAGPPPARETGARRGRGQ